LHCFALIIASGIYLYSEKNVDATDIFNIITGKTEENPNDTPLEKAILKKEE